MNYLKIFSAIIIMTFAINSNAQCPMCKASVESNQKLKTKKVGTGLNTGILYLLAAPYLVIGTVGILWYKKRKK